MSTLKVIGGKQLHGEVVPQGAKNEALQVICASLLCSVGIVVIHNIPKIKDVKNLFGILSHLVVGISEVGKNTYWFEPVRHVDPELSFIETKEFDDMCKTIRASIMLLGPMLGRFGKAVIPKVGGDKIGSRPIDVHINAFKQLGVVFEEKNGKIFCSTPDGLIGADILLEEASVTGTANIVMASVLAKGETVIRNAACEPYLEQLCLMLNSMGAQIVGVGSNVLTIQGVEKLHGCEHTLLPDMIEVGSFIGLAAATKSDILIKNVRWDKLGLIPNIFTKLGVSITKSGSDDIVVSSKGNNIQRTNDGGILVIKDGIWPAFTPDLISIAIVTAVFGNGNVLFHQWMFENRLVFVDQLIQMGAIIVPCDPHRVSVTGLNGSRKLQGIEMSSPDIRAGMALLIAALAAEGESIIHGAEQIDRGYENIVPRLQALGAQIERID